jgi:hypothetical protein
MEGIEGSQIDELEDESDAGDLTILAINMDRTTHDEDPIVTEKTAAVLVETSIPSPNPKSPTLVNPRDAPGLPDSPNLAFPATTFMDSLEMTRHKMLANNSSILNQVRGFRGGYQRPSLTPLRAPWEVRLDYTFCLSRYTI